RPRQIVDRHGGVEQIGVGHGGGDRPVARVGAARRAHRRRRGGAGRGAPRACLVGQRPEALGGDGPGERGRSGQATGAYRGPDGRVLGQHRQLGGQGRVVAGRHQHGGTAAHLVQRLHVGGHHGRPAGHRLHHRQPESLEVRRVGHGHRAAVERHQILLGDVAEQMDAPRGEAQGQLGAQLAIAPALRPHRHQIELAGRRSGARAQPVERPEEQRQVLARLQGPHGQQVRALDPVAGPHARDRRRVGRAANRVGGAGQHQDSLLGDAEQRDDVPTGGLRDGADRHRAARHHRQERPHEGALAGVEELRRPDERQVVDHVDVRAGRGERRQVVGEESEVGARFFQHPAGVPLHPDVAQLRAAGAQAPGPLLGGGRRQRAVPDQRDLVAGARGGDERVDQVLGVVAHAGPFGGAGGDLHGELHGWGRRLSPPIEHVTVLSRPRFGAGSAKNALPSGFFPCAFFAGPPVRTTVEPMSMSLGELGAEGRTALGNVIVKALSVPVEKAGRLLLVIVAAPMLGAAAFGSYQFAFAATTMLALCTDLGMSIWTTRALARDRTRAPAIVATALRLRLAIAIPYLVVVGLAALLAGPGDTRQALVLLGLAALINAFIDYFLAVFRGFERLVDEARLNVARALLMALGGLLALVARRSVASLAVGLLAGLAASGIYGLRILRRGYGLDVRGGRFDRQLARGAARAALPLCLATLFALLYFKGDVVILKAFASDAEVGAYSAAYKIFEGLMIVPAVVLTATFPPLARAKDDPARQRRWEAALVLLLLGLGAAVAPAVYFGSGSIVA